MALSAGSADPGNRCFQGFKRHAADVANRSVLTQLRQTQWHDVAARYSLNVSQLRQLCPGSNLLRQPARKGNAIDRLRETAVIDHLLVTLAE